MVAKAQGASEGRELPRQGFEERGFPRSVGAEDANARPRRDAEAHLFEDDLRGVAEAQPFPLHEGVRALFRIAKGKTKGRSGVHRRIRGQLL